MCASLFLLLLSTIGPIQALSLEEEIGQLLIPYIDGETSDERTFDFLDKYKPGGVILYNWSNGLDSPEQVKCLTKGLQTQADRLKLSPLLIAADQEGGLVARLRNGFTDFPGNAALGRSESEELAFLSAREMGYEMMAVGVNLTLAPAVDVNSNPDNPVIGVRSYGDSATLVARLGLAATHGFTDSGVISCLKHFPGHGDVAIDSHNALPVLEKSRAQLEQLELIPFRHILNASPAIMTAHLRVPALDAERSATLSKSIQTDLLRNELNYEGLIVTDSLSMGALIEDCGDISEAAVRAIEAGSDLLIVGGRTLNDSGESIQEDDLDAIQMALVQAVKSGRLSRERLRESVQRILGVKDSYQVGKHAPPGGDRTLAAEYSHEIAALSVRLDKGCYPTDLWKEKIAIVAPEILREAIELSELDRIGAQCSVHYFAGLQALAVDLEKFQKIDRVVFISYNAWRFSGQADLLKKIAQIKPVVLIAARDARDAALGKNVGTIISTVSPTSTAFKVVRERFIRAAVECELSPDERESIGKKIWFNECHQRKDQLVYWKDGEQWPSVGIGHFIWPPASYQGTFRAGRFHHVLAFFSVHGVELPPWLQGARYSPWESVELFRSEKASVQVEELRALLVDTVPLQAQYMVERFWDSIPHILHGLTHQEQRQVIVRIQSLIGESGGLFALVDYLNFKHEGTAEHEQYKGVRWGLKQVLQGMRDEQAPLEAMVNSAKERLTKRVEVSPKERNEARWIPGWFARLDRYLF